MLLLELGEVERINRDAQELVQEELLLQITTKSKGNGQKWQPLAGGDIGRVCLLGLNGESSPGVQPDLFVYLDQPASQAGTTLKAPTGLAAGKRIGLC
jgi:hypothetical protein